MNGAWSLAQGGLRGTSPCLLLGADGSYPLAKVWVPLWRAIGDWHNVLWALKEMRSWNEVDSSGRLASATCIFIGLYSVYTHNPFKLHISRYAQRQKILLLKRRKWRLRDMVGVELTFMAQFSVKAGIS